MSEEKKPGVPPLSPEQKRQAREDIEREEAAGGLDAEGQGEGSEGENTEDSGVGVLEGGKTKP